MPDKPGALAQHRCLLFGLADYQDTWRVRNKRGRDTEIAITGDIVMSSALALRQAARDGLGPALLADWMTDGDRKSGRLVDLLPTHRVTATMFDTAAWLLYPSRRYLPNKVRVTIDFLRARLGWVVSRN